VPRVQLRSWPVCEKDGLIFAWYDADGAAPDWSVPDALGGAWTASRYEPFTFASQPQEVMENSVDIAHVVALHRGRDARLVEPFQAHGPRAMVHTRFLASGAGLGAPVDWLEIDITFALHGLGYLILDTRSVGSPVRGRTRFCTTPIDDSHVRVLVVNNLEPLPDPGFTRLVEDLFFDAALADFRRDVRMWDSKAHLERPVLVRGDGPILPFRQWAAQFYRPFQAAQSA
jgi:phenylpropionate dioxygenase-like ring-hydroxylating dioxygenase large terminal subunit